MDPNVPLNPSRDSSASDTTVGTTAGAPATLATSFGSDGADFLLALAGRDAQHTWLAGSSTGTGGDWCQGMADTTSFGYIVPFPLP